MFFLQNQRGYNMGGGPQGGPMGGHMQPGSAGATPTGRIGPGWYNLHVKHSIKISYYKILAIKN